MAYSCNYDAFPKSKNTPVIKSRSVMSCFSAIYGRVKDFEKIVIYVLTDYKDFSNNSFPFTKKELNIYIDALQSIGFNFIVKDTTITIPNTRYVKEGNSYEAYAFTINTSENTINGTMILMNLIRMLHEATMPQMIQWFLKSLEEDAPDVSVCDKLILSLYSQEMPNANHSFIGYNNELVLLDSFEEAAFKDKETFYTKTEIKKTKSLGSVYEDEDDPSIIKSIHKMLQSKIPLQEKKKKYNEICEKYL